MEIQTKELMIGDWVLYEGEPYKIRQLGIYGVDRDGEDYPAVCIGKPKGIGLILERNEIEPIPLTPEILEKNGWVNEHFGKQRQEWWLDKTKFPIVKYSINSHFHHNGIVLSYVHQLQHALRLCGIEKEIVL